MFIMLLIVFFETRVYYVIMLNSETDHSKKINSGCRRGMVMFLVLNDRRARE